MEQHPWKGKDSGNTQVNDTKEQVSKYFDNLKTPVKFGTFVKFFSKILNDAKNLFVEHEINGPFEKPMIRMLLTAIGLGKGTDEVKWENVEHLFLWFPGTGKKEEFLENIYSLMNEDWFFGLYKNQQDIQKFFSQAKTGNYCVNWEMILKKFILSYMKGPDIVQVVLEQQSIEELRFYMKTAPHNLELKDPLTTKPELLKKLKMKEAFATAASSDYISYNTDVKQQHFLFV